MLRVLQETYAEIFGHFLESSNAAETTLVFRGQKLKLRHYLKEIPLDKRHFLHATVTAEIKRRIRAAAAAESVTPTAWLRSVAIRALPPQPLDLVRGEPEEGPGDRGENRLYVRLASRPAPSLWRARFQVLRTESTHPGPSPGNLGPSPGNLEH